MPRSAQKLSSVGGVAKKNGKAAAAQRVVKKRKRDDGAAAAANENKVKRVKKVKVRPPPTVAPTEPVPPASEYTAPTETPRRRRRRWTSLRYLRSIINAQNGKWEASDGTTKTTASFEPTMPFGTLQRLVQAIGIDYNPNIRFTAKARRALLEASESYLSEIVHFAAHLKHEYAPNRVRLMPKDFRSALYLLSKDPAVLPPGTYLTHKDISVKRAAAAAAKPKKSAPAAAAAAAAATAAEDTAVPPSAPPPMPVADASSDTD